MVSFTSTAITLLAATSLAQPVFGSNFSLFKRADMNQVRGNNAVFSRENPTSLELKFQECAPGDPKEHIDIVKIPNDPKSFIIKAKDGSFTQECHDVGEEYMKLTNKPLMPDGPLKKNADGTYTITPTAKDLPGYQKHAIAA